MLVILIGHTIAGDRVGRCRREGPGSVSEVRRREEGLDGFICRARVPQSMEPEDEAPPPGHGFCCWVLVFLRLGGEEEEDQQERGCGEGDGEN